MTSLPVLNYTQRDPDLILSTMKSELARVTENGWTDFTDNDLGYAVVKAAVALYDVNAFFCDQQVAETFISIASMRESVIRRAKELGYTPRQASPAEVTVLLSFPSFNTGFTIPANSSWVINDINFQCLEPIEISPNATSAEVVLTQGSPYLSTTAGTGVSWTKLILPVTASRIVVKVNDVVWTPVTTFIEVPQATSYRVYEDVGGQTIKFGVNLDGLSIPMPSDTVVVSAILTSGRAGNIYQNGQNVRPQSVIRNADGATVTSAFSGVTLTSAIGGDNVESTTSIRENAPKFYGSQDRGVSEDDIAAIVRTIPGIKDASAIGGEKLGSYGHIFITAYGSSPYELTSDLQTQILRLLDIKGVGGMTYVIDSPKVLEVQQTISLGLSRAVYSTTDSAVNLTQTGLSEFFDELRVSKPLYYSVENAVVEDIPGVVYNNIANTFNTFAVSQANKAIIPVPLSADLTDVVLKNAAGTVLFSGNATSLVSNGVFTLVVPGLTDQKCTLHFANNGPDVIVAHGMIPVLTSLTVNPILVSPGQNPWQ